MADAALDLTDGAHWWVEGFGDNHTFSCNGYEGQFSIAVPSHNMIVVRLGVSPDNEVMQGPRMKAQLGRVVTELCATVGARL